MPLSDYQSLVESLVRDDTGKVGANDLDVAIALAVDRYSADRPRHKSEDLVSPGGNTLPLPTTDYDATFSEIESLEYPIGEFPPVFIDSTAWALYTAPTGDQLTLAQSLSTGQEVRALFTIKHVLDETTDTIPAIDKEAVASWAAAFLCDQLASLYSGDSDTTIQADNVDHGGKAREFAMRANSLRKRYHDLLGIDPKRNAAAGVVVDMDMSNSVGGDRLTHPRRYR